MGPKQIFAAVAALLVIVGFALAANTIPLFGGAILALAVAVAWPG